jgi:hypothetical protein
MRTAAGIVVAAILAAGLAATLSWSAPPWPAGATATKPVWNEAVWPFPNDPWGKGKAFRCKAADCGIEVNLYLRAKIGFCNCKTGVADDDDLDRMGDLVLVGNAFPLGAGRPVTVAWMKGRSRAYRLDAGGWSGKSAISVVYNDRCDMIVATAVVRHDRPELTESRVLDFLNGGTVMRWAEVTLGL